MRIDEYLAVKKQLREYADNVEESKRPSYTAGSENVLENFIRDGKLQGLDPMQNWLSHFLKQVAAICSYVRNPEIEPSEPFISRAADLQTYATLGLALAKLQGRKGTGLGHDIGKVTVVPDGYVADFVHKDSSYGY